MLFLNIAAQSYTLNGALRTPQHHVVAPRVTAAAMGMDISELIEDAKKTRLEHLEEQALSALRVAVDKFDRVVFPNAMIVGDCVITHLLGKIGALESGKAKIMVVDTYHLFDDTMPFLAAVEEKYGFTADVFGPEGLPSARNLSPETFADFDKKYGANLWKEDIEQYDKICKVRSPPPTFYPPLHSLQAVLPVPTASFLQPNPFPAYAFLLHCLRRVIHILDTLCPLASTRSSTRPLAHLHICPPLVRSPIQPARPLGYSSTCALACPFTQVEPFQRGLKTLNADIMINGRRRDHGAERAYIDIAEIAPIGGGLAKLNPLAYWTLEDCFDYAAKEGVPLHPSVERGYPSQGDAKDTVPVPDPEGLSGVTGEAGSVKWVKGEWTGDKAIWLDYGAERKGRFVNLVNKDGTKKTECGIHVAGAEKTFDRDLWESGVETLATPEDVRFASPPSARASSPLARVLFPSQRVPRSVNIPASLISSHRSASRISSQ